MKTAACVALTKPGSKAITVTLAITNPWFRPPIYHVVVDDPQDTEEFYARKYVRSDQEQWPRESRPGRYLTPEPAKAARTDFEHTIASYQRAGWIRNDR